MTMEVARLIESMINNERSAESIVRYEEKVGIDLTRALCFDDIPFYRNYLKRFDADDIEMVLPEYTDEDFDRPLLLRLTAGSFSSQWAFEASKEGRVRLRIDVSMGEKSVRKYLDELWGFQVARMYEIYFNEMIEMETLMFEEPSQRDAIMEKRMRNLEYFETQRAFYTRIKTFGSLSERYESKSV